MDKKLLFRSVFSVLLSGIFITANATIHVVQVSSNQFTPNAINSVVVGDTIRWIWQSGSHTTTSVSVPVGAATWDSPMNSNTTQFDYKVTVAGNYGYKCTPHQSMGMVGGFVASSITGISEANLNPTSLFPNPFTNELFIEQGNEEPPYTQVLISDILGKQIKTITIEMLASSAGNRKIDVSELPKGIYFATLKGDGAKMRTIRLVKE